jgi:hypothetical protein
MVAQAQMQRETASRETSSGLRWGIHHVRTDDESDSTNTNSMVTDLEKSILDDVVRHAVAYAIF